MAGNKKGGEVFGAGAKMRAACASEQEKRGEVVGGGAASGADSSGAGVGNSGEGAGNSGEGVGNFGVSSSGAGVGNFGEGKLIICPTPIGNLGDVSVRMREALENAQVVCAEDTRVTGKLLAVLGIKRPLERLDEATLGSRAAGVVARVLSGETITYCSDAGMPGISDPGLRLVRAAREAGANVEVLPGPVAAATAYVASGCTNQRFFFAGFFPRKNAERRTFLASVATLDAALIFYESPKRLVDALNVIAEVFPYRELAVCRELTKLHEEVVRGTTAHVRDVFTSRAAAEDIKGEIVIVIDGPSAQEEATAAQSAATSGAARAKELHDQGLSKKDITKALVSELGLSRNEAYELALSAGGE